MYTTFDCPLIGLLYSGQAINKIRRTNLQTRMQGYAMDNSRDHGIRSSFSLINGCLRGNLGGTDPRLVLLAVSILASCLQVRKYSTLSTVPLVW